jgi:CRP-like cAMP-binding protein
LLSKIDFFANNTKIKDISQAELEEVARNMKYEYKKPGDVIFNSLDTADKFYIVLKGRVMVQIPAPDNT